MDCGGKVPQDNSTTPLKLFVGVTVTVYAADFPALTEVNAGVAVTV